MSPRSKAGARAAEQDALRRDGRHCPVCLVALPRLSGQRRSAQVCPGCGAHPVETLRCAACQQSGVWQGRTGGAACPACGHHGSKVKVIAGQEWLERPRRGHE